MASPLCIGSHVHSNRHRHQHRINEAKKYSKDGRFEPGYILDSFEEERAQEMTIDTTRAEMLYKDNLFEFIDVPGHLELIKNMMSGASHGEIAILMVSMKEGEGLQPQTKRHVYIANMLGIKGTHRGDKQDGLGGLRQEGVRQGKGRDISNYLKAIGFSKPVSYVPVSAYDSQNLIKSSDEDGMVHWNAPHRGACLFTTSRKVSTTKNGLRAIVQDVVDHEQQGDDILPIKQRNHKDGPKGKARAHRRYGEGAGDIPEGREDRSAGSGTNIAIVIDGKEHAKRGFVICGAEDSPHSTKEFESITFFIKPVSKDEKFDIKINNNTVPVKMEAVKEFISPVTGGSKPGAAKIPAGTAARIHLKLGEKYPIERFSDYNELGRFALYSKGVFCGIGIVV